MSLVGADSENFVSGLQVRTKYNADLLIIVQKFKQATAPTDTEPLMWWFDTATSILKLRNEADDAWISLFYLDGSNNLYLIGPTRIIENSDTITLTHDGTDARITMSDGKLVVQTAEGTNTDTTLAVKGKGTGQGQIEIWDQSATNRVTIEVADAIGADRSFGLPANAPVDTYALVYDSTLGRLKYAAPTAGGGGAASIFPGTLMNFLRSGTSAAPNYMYLTGTGATITMISAAAKTDKGWQAQITNGASNTARFGWNTAQNNCSSKVDVKKARGNKIAMGAWIYCDTADRVKLEMSDGTTTTTSAACHAGGGWEWMQVTLAADVDASATDLTAYVLIEAGTAITVYVEVPCVVIGTSCPRHVGYTGGGRIHAEGYSRTSDGAVAYTGCGFSPVMVKCLNREMAGNYWTGEGYGYLEGATTHMMARDAYGTAYTTSIQSTGNCGNRYAAVTSWDIDGLTVNFVLNSANCIGFLLFYEGHPE